MKAPDFSYFEAQNIEDAIKYKSGDDEAVIPVSYTHLTLPTKA